MAVTVADAVINLILNLDQFEQSMQQVEARIAEVEQRASQAGAAASQAASQAQAAAGSAQTAVSSASGAGGGAGAAFDAAFPNLAGFSTLPGSISQAMSPSSPSGRGWSLGEDIGASLRLVGVRMSDGTPMGEAAAAGGLTVGDAMMKGTAQGVEAGKGVFADAVKRAVDEALAAGKQAAEAESPSRRAAREIGGPIMEGVGVGIMAGTGAVTQAMFTSLGFSFNRWKANTFGGTFVGSGLNVVENPGGTLGGGGSLGNWFEMLGASINNSFDIAKPTGLGMSSRVLMSNIPTGIRDMGQDLLSGVIGSILPGWAAGPLSDMVGTFLGLKPVLSREAITAPSMSADQGGFSDYPYGGGTIFNVNNNFNGNFTDVERQVSLGILQSARRLGVYI